MGSRISRDHSYILEDAMLRAFIIAACLIVSACSSAVPVRCGFCSDLAGTGAQE
jgi:hypothetical protein